MARQSVDRRLFSSKSSDKSYVAIRYDDGTFSCDCKGWTMKKKGWSRYCSHTADMGDKKVADMNDAFSIAEAVMEVRSLRGERFNILKRYTDAQTGERRVVVQPRLSADGAWSYLDRNRTMTSLPARVIDRRVRPMVTPPKPIVPMRACDIEPPPARARIVFDEEV